MTDAEKEFEGITWQDYLVIAFYFMFVLAVGLLSTYWSKRDSLSGYFLSARSMTFVPVGASLFASNIGSGHFIGLAGSGAGTGIGVSAFELNAIFYILLLGWVFVPVYMASGVYTMPEYLRRRFGGQRIGVYLSVLTLLLYVFTKISSDLFAGALFITQSTRIVGDSAIYVAILILLFIASIFTIVGGLSAVIWTDAVQTVIMIIGAIILSATGFSRTGGYEEMIGKFFVAVAENRSHEVPDDPTTPLCASPPSDAMHIFRSAKPGESSDLPWTGVVLGLSINSVWYWCSDQVIVQRVLASKNMTHAKGGTLLCSLLKLLPLYIMIFPGMMSRVLFPNEIACASPEDCDRVCGSRAGCTNIAFIKLVNETMPVGLRGLMLAVMLAALMSSLTSIFNSSSAIFTMDIYKRIRKSASETELLIAGRLFVIFLVVVSVAWIPIINQVQGSLFDYMQMSLSYLAPPVCAVYLLAIFWPRCNETGAFWALMAGLLVGGIRFGLEFGYSKPACGSGDPRPPDWWYSLVDRMHYTHFGVLLWAITVIVAVLGSIATEPIPKESLHRLTFWSRHSTKVRVELDKEDEREHAQKAVKEEERESTTTTSATSEVTSRCRLCLNFLCGIKSGSKGEEETAESSDGGSAKMSEEERARKAAEFLRESRRRKWMVNASAVAIMSVTAFVIGFYA